MNVINVSIPIIVATVSVKAGKSVARKLYVCTVCGMTTTNLDFAKCRSCFQPKDKYVVVS